MRVLHVMEATIGGTRRHLVDVARGQHGAGLEVHLAVATARDPDFPADLEQLEQLGVSVHRLPMVREIRPGRDLADTLAMRRLLRGLRPDVVHTHCSKAGVLGRAASLSTGIGRRVHTPHTFAFLFEALFGPRKRALFRTIEKTLAARTQRLVAVSEGEAETFRRSGVVPPERVRVVPNGIDPTRFEGAEPLDVAALGLDPRRPLLAVVGLVYEAKGQDLLIEALARPGLEEVQLLVVGPGDRSRHEARAAALGLEPRLRFLGARRDVPAILAAADALVLPSRWEGMPYIVLEAMAASRPVVANPVDGARELVQHGRTGLLCEEIGIDALAGRLRELLALPAEERLALGRAGRRRLDQGYSIESMVAGLIGVYEEVLP